MAVLHTLSMMVLLYLALGWVVERYATSPESQVRAFFRILCSPITRPIARRMKAEPTDRRVMRAALIMAGAVFVVFGIVVRVL